MPSMATSHGGVLYYVVKVPREEVTITCTDSGWDNPFRPDGDLSKEADEIVEQIKSGKPITPVGNSNSSPLPGGGGGGGGDHIDSKNTSTPITESPKKSNASKLSATPKGAKNGNLSSPAAKGADGSVDVQRGTVAAETNDVEHVIIKKKPKCKCCVIQ